MMSFAWPWAAFLLSLPFLAWRLPPATQAASAALRVPFYSELAHLSATASHSPPVNRRQRQLAALIYVLLVLAAMRPQWLGTAIEIPVSGRDLMLAVDLSGSMETPDLTVNGQQVDRLRVVKAVLGEFIERRQGDRLGLILFGAQPYLQTPLTFDRKTVQTLLDEAVIGLAGKEHTAIGDAIGLAVKRLRDRPAENRVLILLTDGANNAGEIDPKKAAELAAQAQIKIYTIGVGADEMEVQTLFGPRRVNPSADLDEAMLRAVAKTTGGLYFRARDTAGLAQVYQQLDQLEPVVVDKQHYRPITPLYPWPLGVALLLSVGLAWRRAVG